MRIQSRIQSQNQDDLSACVLFVSYGTKRATDQRKTVLRLTQAERNILSVFYVGILGVCSCQCFLHNDVVRLVSYLIIF